MRNETCLAVRLAGLLSVLMLLAACDTAEPESPLMAESQLQHLDTIVTTENGLLGRVSGIAVGADGTLWVADDMNHRVLHLDPQGELISELGSEGSGPGEFSRPHGVAVSDSSIFVFDLGNRRLVELDHEGRSLGTRTVSAPASTVMDVSARGALALSNTGREPHLLWLLPPDTEDPQALGTARAEMPSEISPVSLGEQVAEGQIPDVFQNIALPILSRDGGAYLLVQSEGTLERYSPGGTLAWSRELALPEVEAAIDRFFRGWEEGVDWPRSFPVPTTARWGREVGDELWLMMDSVDEVGSTLVVIDGASGDPIRRVRIELEGRGGPFAVDPARNVIYLAVPDEAILLRGELP